ncbi:Mur ligase family protein [Quadrisphaera sp. INWT6]|uniref:Mur ligase family protein n=1 Tax=Quadrisphaera sp. INWT6 TaxID=2596917 RepID=UPI00189225B1|nr:UDP-N-acetylmuramoyl-L-alanyl-D-glutamate--2,6-diaminopimelate ligase [Quadrisphaera sp. INWT6]MBF5083390.1 UDP-N-acetylmuramoyl-L-alanyl-D-glutamate--2,6-diaminopimelate ligase [Quadrisphaera sp. INWT6]
MSRPRAPRGHRPKTLAEVASFLGAAPPPGQPGPGDGPVVTGLHHDSRRVGPGDLWLALPGAGRHGAGFAPAALARGAVAAVSDRPCPGLTTLLVSDPRARAGPLADWLYDHPSAELDVIGVTGTNGKTSTTHLLHAGAAAAAAGALGAGGRPAGLLSGVVTRGPGVDRPAVLTTAEAADLQRDLAVFRDAGVATAALEVSSHALALHRVDGTRFRAAVFTNLAADHLDLHRDMDGYFEAKARLFEPGRCALAVVSVDDRWGHRLARRVADDGRVPLVTTSARGQPADWTATRVEATATGTRFRLRGPTADRAVHLRLLGAHQADNALSALAALAATGADLDAAVLGVERLALVPGRMEVVDAGQPFLALVDFAHNAHGVERALAHLRTLTAGRLHVVVGQRGGRDPGKPGPLGAAVGRLADVVVVTDEGAHDQDPALLRALVAAGARSGGRAVVREVPDRADAFAAAVAGARPGDVVVVLGRGAGREMTTGTRTDGFDDRVALRAALVAARGPVLRPASAASATARRRPAAPRPGSGPPP